MKKGNCIILDETGLPWMDDQGVTVLFDNTTHAWTNAVDLSREFPEQRFYVLQVMLPPVLTRLGATVTDDG